MIRQSMNKLIKWKESKYRKPLIINGARQVGKTWLLKEFGELEYENVVYINFDENNEYAQFFESTKNIDRILENLRAITSQKICPGETLLIFDEIQECPDALNALKYFFENGREYHVACAGSLLGVKLAKSKGFPVGSVDFIDLYPMTFLEFLEANGDTNLTEYIKSIDKPENIPDAFAGPLLEKFKIYLTIGGMPEAIKYWVNDQDMALVNNTLKNILTAYERDFIKHLSKTEYPKVSLVWNSLSSQLSKENKKFLYKVVKPGARAREYENAIEWLSGANLIYKIYRSNKPGIPLKNYDDLSAFKLYLMDVGLLREMSSLDSSAIKDGDRLFTEFKGALIENYVLESLISNCEPTPRYWAVDNPNYEVDFIIQIKNDIIPVEVKSSNNKKSKSLTKYREKYAENTKLCVRFSTNNLTLDGDILNIPLYLADIAVPLISQALLGK